MLTAIEAALSLIPRWLLLAALIGVIAWGGIVGHRLTVSQRDAARMSASIATERAQIAAAAASASEHARAVEQARSAAISHAEDAYHDQITIVAADADRSRNAAERLRNALAIAARTLRASSGARSPGAAPGGAAAGPDPAVLADMLGRCVGHVRDLAGYADRSRAAGQLCQAYADSLMR